ncbi:nuclear transport factor 2 family protein [Rhodanobacter sp. DHG33]|uniref:nuclear transport factor 2 family protein n=1 Tax=Rhodanobacter sp. DHG33 TaxID=2775921 RepID=UPI0017848FC1|nr:nuclear transport factor 2 family protein [Rhodanobacter sp. DHG33]MBD8900154.1 nuclear transport factor 2 family protein [Rhodanobacter sp. DHG33]
MPALARILSVPLLAMLYPLSAAACANKSNDPAEVVQAQVDAYNAHDVAAFASCYADNVTVTDLSGKRPVIAGVEALKHGYAFLATVPKEFHVAIVQRVVNGPIVVDQERVMGLPADKGQPEAIAVYEVRDGKIQHVWFPPRD